MFHYSENKKSIKEISTMFRDEELIVDDTYQRRSVWSEKDKVRLIETVLLHLIIPVLFFWKADTDPETGISTTHIVDGQQRIKAICSYLNNEFKLKPQYLLDDDIKEKYANKYFKELDPADKQSFWNYNLLVIDIDSHATRDDIITMFNRLNLTDYSLNDQEKRNSKSGEFAALARQLSVEPLWEEKRLFSITDVRRMKDVEFCASLILLYRKGIIDQTDQSALNQAYEELQEGYDEAENDKKAVLAALDTVSNFFISDSVTRFLRKKTQLYTLFSVVFSMQRNGLEVTKKQLDNLQMFIDMYSVFSNDIELSGQVDEKEKKLFDLLKKYKLASSEGLNKHTNRMIRYNVMKEFMFEISDELDKAGKTLIEKMTKTNVSIEQDPDE